MINISQETCLYEAVKKHIGCCLKNCKTDARNLGLIGHPKDLLDDVDLKCTEGVAKCAEFGKRSCDRIQDCWGFAIHKGLDVKIYNSSASNPSMCWGTHGLRPNAAWTTFKKATCNKYGKRINDSSALTLIIKFGGIYHYIINLFILEIQCTSDSDCAKVGKKLQCCTRRGRNQGKCFNKVNFDAKCG